MSSSATSTLSRSGIPSMHRKLAAKNRTKDGFDVFQIAAEGKITDMNSIVNKNCELLKSVDEVITQIIFNKLLRMIDSLFIGQLKQEIGKM